MYRAFGVLKEAMTTRLRELDLVRFGRSGGGIASGVRPAILLPVASPFEAKGPPLQSLAMSPATRSVALIGDYWDHRNNRRLLKQHGWTAVEDDSADGIAKLCADPPCGVVVHSSFWKRVPSGQRSEAFKALIELSSFILVRLDLSGASGLVATAVAKLPPALLDQRPVGAFRQNSDGQLAEADLAACSRSSS